MRWLEGEESRKGTERSERKELPGIHKAKGLRQNEGDERGKIRGEGKWREKSR